MSVSILNISHRKRERNNYHAYNINGFPPEIYLFIHFLAPAIVVLGDVPHKVEKDACIIYTPGFKQDYKHYNGVFENGFMIFKTCDPNFVARYGLPENEIFHITNGDEINFQMELITYTLTDKLVDRSEETKEHLSNLFESLSRFCVDNNPGAKRNHEVKKRFTLMRDLVRQNPKEWTVGKMAKHVWLTRSRFAVLYSKIFNTSPSSDLISMKIEYAKELLEKGELTVAEISAECGYDSVSNFIKLFKKHANLTPLQYRKNLHKK